MRSSIGVARRFSCHLSLLSLPPVTTPGHYRPDSAKTSPNPCLESAAAAFALATKATTVPNTASPLHPTIRRLGSIFLAPSWEKVSIFL